jgi:DNA-binding MarR family transcriptional regulator
MTTQQPARASAALPTSVELSPHEARVLRALFELARLDRPASAFVLGGHLSVTPTLVARALVELSRRGLVRAERARLTLPGLAVAVRLPALGLEAAAHKAEHEQVQARRGAWTRRPTRSSLRRSGVEGRSEDRELRAPGAPALGRHGHAVSGPAERRGRLHA